jgi:hypothetical protein
VSTTEELLGRNSSGPGLERREYGRRDSSRFRDGVHIIYFVLYFWGDT